MSDPLSLDTLLTRPGVTLLAPPVLPYRLTIASLLLLALWALGWGASSWGAMSFVHWVALLAGALIALLLLLPRSWQPSRLAELGWDRQWLYLLCADRALPVARSAITALHLERQIGDQGEWLGFALDLRLDPAELASALALLQRPPEQHYEIAPGVYRFAFRRAWHRQGQLAKMLAGLEPC